MKLENLDSFNPENIDIRDNFSFECIPGIDRGDQINLKLLKKKYGVKVLKKIPVECIDGNLSDINVTLAGYDMYVCKYKHIVFGFIKGRYLVFSTNTLRESKYYLRRLVHRERRVYARQPQSVSSIVDRFREFLDTQYLNELTKNEIVSAVTPYIATFKKRRHFKINMCLSVVFTGEPGDGKTYVASEISQWISSKLGLLHVTEEVTVFGKAAKLVGDFVAVIDDMNVAHFRRDRGMGDICQNILSEMDRPSCNRLFFLTTNEHVAEGNIDKAFFRPGRIQQIIQFRRPNEAVKSQVIDEMVEAIERENVEMPSKDFLAGVKLLTAEDNTISLAETMRLKNLILTDIILEKPLGHPNAYIKGCRKLDTQENEYAENSHE